MHFHKTKNKSNIVIAKYKGVLSRFMMDCNFPSGALCFPRWYVLRYFLLHLILFKYYLFTFKAHTLFYSKPNNTYTWQYLKNP